MVSEGVPGGTSGKPTAADGGSGSGSWDAAPSNEAARRDPRLVVKYFRKFHITHKPTPIPELSSASWSEPVDEARPENSSRPALCSAHS